MNFPQPLMLASSLTTFGAHIICRRLLTALQSKLDQFKTITIKVRAGPLKKLRQHSPSYSFGKIFLAELMTFSSIFLSSWRDFL